MHHTIIISRIMLATGICFDIFEGVYCQEGERNCGKQNEANNRSNVKTMIYLFHDTVYISPTQEKGF